RRNREASRRKYMSNRTLGLGVVQIGGIQPDDTRAEVVERLVRHLRTASERGAEFVVFPELTLTTFFPRYWFEDQSDADRYFEKEMPSEETAPLFEAAAELNCGFYLGYAE